MPVAKFVKAQIINEMTNVKLQIFFPKSNNPSNRFNIKITDALAGFQKQWQYIKYLLVEQEKAFDLTSFMISKIGKLTI